MRREVRPDVGDLEPFDKSGQEGVVEPAHRAGMAGGEGVERAVVQQYPIGLCPRLEPELGQCGDQVGAVLGPQRRTEGVSAPVGVLRGGTVRVGGVVVDGVDVTDGTHLPADLALVGVGITPAIELAEAAGLAADNGVAVDAGLRTSDPDIYAAGDVANAAHPLLGKPIRVEHWSNALNGGKAAAHAMLGEPVAYDRMPYFFTDQYDLGMEYSGLGRHRRHPRPGSRRPRRAGRGSGQARRSGRPPV